MFVSQTYKIINNGFAVIDNGKKEIFCRDFNIYDLQFEDQKLFFGFTSNYYNISSIVIEINNSKENIEFENLVLKGTSKYVEFNNVTVKDKFNITINDCRKGYVYEK